MYSKNDYRYYLEHRLAMSDDFLAHYGVKGMKWKHHNANPLDRLVNIGRTLENNYRNNTIQNLLDRKKSPDRVIRRSEKKVEKLTNKTNKKIDRIQKRSNKAKKKSDYYQNRINKIKSKDTIYDGVKRELREAYEGQKKDIKRIARNAKKSDTYKNAKKFAKGVKREARDAYEGQKKDIKRIANNVKKSDTYKNAKKFAKGVKREARDAYEGQKKDIKRIARNVKKRTRKNRRR